MDGLLVGVFGTEADAKAALESALGKKSEVEGTVIYHRTDSGKKLSFLDDIQFPQRIQGSARIASISEHALFVFPRSGKLGAADGEIAVLLESFALKGTIELVDSGTAPEAARAAFKGTALSGYPVEERSSKSTVLRIDGLEPEGDAPLAGTLLYIDRAFTVKGVGTVALGFVLSGSVSVHDKLRPIPGRDGLEADVKGIQVNDEDLDRREGNQGRALAKGRCAGGSREGTLDGRRDVSPF